MKKILVIRFSSIGDIVLTSPVVRCLKNQLEDCEIHFLTKKAFLPVVENNPNIDKIYSIEKDISEVSEKLKNENYDHIVDLHKNLRSWGVILKLRKPSSSFSKLNRQKWLMVKTKINHLPNTHIVDRYFKAVTPLGVVNYNQGLDYFISDVEEVPTDTLPETHRHGFVAWVIGAKHKTKAYPEDLIIQTCNKYKKPVTLLGGPEDQTMGERIQSATGSWVYNACGKYKLNQSASLVQQADNVITNDTGLMHIAAAFKKKIISLWGNTIPEFGMYPYLPENQERSTILEVKGLKCRPCSKLGFEKCPKSHFKCMRDINVRL